MIQFSQAQRQIDVAGVVGRWNALSSNERRRAWSSYERAIDEGGAGWHPFALVLHEAHHYGWDAGVELIIDDIGLLRPASGRNG